ncbi:MAG: ribose 5-phosphate isomerase B [Candidatus Dadabacteria bacterium]|nr:ribose 5-phosphate isomerase B [Candidatus Dadabacteria bacterium]
MAKNALAIACDHAGLELKNEVKRYVLELGYEVEDFGTDTTEKVDYPDFAREVSERVSSGQYKRGILVCSSGVGMAIVANKYPRVRAVLAGDAHTALMSRKHNDANVLTLGANITPKEKALEIVSVWLRTEFEGGRHEKRINKIRDIEKEAKQNE